MCYTHCSKNCSKLLLAGYFYNTSRCAVAMDTLSIFYEFLIILVGIRTYMVVNRV